jgi:hypothetical protein
MHAVLIDFGIAPIVLRISTGQNAARVDGESASRAHLVLSRSSTCRSAGAVATQSTATANATPRAVGSRPRPRFPADPKTTGKPDAEGTISMGDSRYREAIFKLDIISSSGALSP